MATMARISGYLAICKVLVTDLATSANDVLALEIAAAGTPYSAKVSNAGSQTAFESLLQGDLWMIYRNVLTDVLHFDFVSSSFYMVIALIDPPAERA